MAQFASIGLSSVGSQLFENENLFFYVPEVGDRFGWSVAAGDFNGDGVQDLATGMPYDDGLFGSGLTDSGIVIVRYGVAGQGLAEGLASTVLSQNGGGSINPAEAGDLYGFALAAGDFNNDGSDDLAVGVPRDRYWHDEDAEYRSAGGVDIHYGGAGGIQTTAEHHRQNRYHNGDRFGEALAVGDFNADGHADLAIGSPGFHSLSLDGFVWQAGAVFVHYGHIGGLFPFQGTYIDQDSEGVDDWTQLDEEFGESVAAGDFDGDGFDDLAVGIPKEENCGAIQVFAGTANGIDRTSNEIWLQADLPGGGANEEGDLFGFRLAVGDFDGSGHDDLAIGAPSEDLPGGGDAGEVTVIYGTPSGPTWFDLSRTDTLQQGAIFGSAAFDQPGDIFGHALAAGDFDGDGRDDLAIGQPGEDVGGTNRGGVTVLMGGQFGLYERFRFLAAGINGLPPGVQNHSDMGKALAVGDFDASGTADLAIGIPFRDGAASDVGAVTVLYGALFSDGFGSGNVWYWSVE